MSKYFSTFFFQVLFFLDFKVSKYFRPYQRTDVVVFRAPPAFAEFVDESKANEDLIKRIVGVAGFFLFRCFRFSFFVGWS